MRKFRILHVWVLLVFALTACASQAAGPSADDPEFEGIDRSVVEEVLASKAVAFRTAGDDQQMLLTRLQGIALNFVLCRQAYSAYEDWRTTGLPQMLPVPLHVAKPRQMAYAQYRRDWTEFQRLLSGGDIDVLRGRLLNESGCGVWIPLKPGDQAGPTIAEAIQGK